MTGIVNWIHFLAFVSVFGPRFGLPGRLAPKYEFLQNCEDVSGLSARMTKVDITRIGPHHDYVLNADVVVEEVVEKVAKGNYTMRNATLDMGLVSHLPLPDLEKRFWRARIEGYDPNMNMCLEVGLRFYRTRT